MPEEVNRASWKETPNQNMFSFPGLGDTEGLAWFGRRSQPRSGLLYKSTPAVLEAGVGEIVLDLDPSGERIVGTLGEEKERWGEAYCLSSVSGSPVWDHRPEPGEKVRTGWSLLGYPVSEPGRDGRAVSELLRL